MTFLNPMYLWGLLGLAVPLAIHLWSKKEGKTIKIGSIQLLAQTDPKQASSIQLNELFLLFLRLILLGILVCILASPQAKKKTKTADVVYLIEPALLDNNDIREMVDSLPEEKTFLLQNDFPKWKRDENVNILNKTPNYWQLAQEMESLHADSIVVFTRGLLQGFKGKRPTVNSTINWIILTPETVEDQLLASIQTSDSITLISVNSASDQLEYEREKVSRSSVEMNNSRDSIAIMRNGQKHRLPLFTRDTLYIQIASVDSLKAEKKYIEASLRAVSNYTEILFEISEINGSINPKTEIVIWLKNDTIPEFKGKIIRYKANKFAENLVVSTKNPAVFELTGRLNSENIVSQKFPEQVLSFLNLYPTIEKLSKPFDKTSLAKNILQPHSKAPKKADYIVKTMDLSPWFWLIFILAFITERITAYYRKQ
ncbi:BatA domain-containing protein [Flavimarina sp. Hel_I_48]|uniref:BatA domain-containing protein n=1 Tax=Flavimarina sp. Hel_I_48 TaxID=1392488 RepID=UPI0004DEE74C|nr:BatA domain-containing protein [Flavimarina sp. Hel_I_48]